MPVERGLAVASGAVEPAWVSGWRGHKIQQPPPVSRCLSYTLAVPTPGQHHRHGGELHQRCERDGRPGPAGCVAQRA